MGPPITRFNAKDFKTQFSCEVKNFNPTNFLDRKESRKLDLFSQYVGCCGQAVKQSNLNLNEINSDRAGVIWGSGIGGMFTFFNESSNYALGNGTPRFNPFFIPKLISDIPATSL